MSIKKQAFKKAMGIIEQREQNSKLLLSEREAEIAQKLPSVYALKKELADTAVKLSKAIFMSSGDIKEKIEQLKQNNLEIQQKIAHELTTNGYPADYLSLPFYCKDCKDTGLIGNNKCKCLKALEAKIMAEYLSSCSNIKDCRFDNFSLDYYSDKEIDGKMSPRNTMSKIYSFCKNYAETYSDNAKSLFLFGGTGLGKTHLSLAIAGEVVEKGVAVLYGSAQNFLRIIEDEHFGRVSKDSDTLDELLGAQLLIIDDLGVEFNSEFNVSTIYNIIDTRFNLGKPTIVNTNLSPAELERRYSARIVSRLFSGYICLKCDGNDVRLLKAQNRRNG